MSRHSRHVWGLALLSLIATAGASGQTCSNYAIKSVPSPGFTSGGSDIGNHCDDCTSPLTFPFPVTLYGISYTQAIVTSNGVIQFQADTHSFSNDCLPTSRTAGPAIFAFWNDIRTDSFDGSGIFTRVDGVAPGRVFNVEWNVGYFGHGGTANFVARFFEGQDSFQLEYGAIDDATAATIGVQAGSGGPASTVACNANTGYAHRLYTFDCAAPRITYQGKLTNEGTPAEGFFDMNFAMFRDRTGGTVVSSQLVPGVEVTKGLFTVPLDMPSLRYDNEPLFLEITVGGHLLTGRQELTFAPKAAFAVNSTKADLSDRASVATRAEGLSSPDGSPMDAAYVANDGSVVVTGTLYANNLVLSPYTSWLMIPPSGLDPTSSTMGHLHLSAAELVGTNPNEEISFQTWLHLPPSCTITHLEFVGYDNTGGTDVLLTLERVTFASIASEVVASVSSDGSFPEYRQFATGSLNIHFNGQTDAIVLRAHWHVPPAVPNNVRLSNIRVTYVVGPTPE